MSFVLSNIIPTSSRSKGMTFHRNNFYFSSSNSIYILKKNKITFLTDLHRKIKDVQSNGKFVFAQTNERIYMLRGSKILATLKMTGSFTLTGTELIIGEKNLYCFLLPVNFSFTMFKKINDVRAHSENITKVKVLEDGIFLSVSEDSTVRMSSFRDGRSRVICYHRELPVDVFAFQDHTKDEERDSMSGDFLEKVGEKINEIADKNSFSNGKNSVEEDILDTLKMNYFIVTVSQNGTINKFSTRKGKIVKRTFLDREVFDAKRWGEFLVLLGEGEIFIVRDDFVKRVAVDISAYEMEILTGKIILRGAEAISVYEFPRENAPLSDEDGASSLCCLNPFSLPKILDFFECNGVVLSCSDNKVRKVFLSGNDCVYEDAFDVEEPIFRAFYKNNVLICITETCLVKAFDTKRGNLFREINLSFKVCGADTNEDNSILFVCNYDSYEISVVDIKRSKIIDGLKMGAPIRKLCYFGNSVYFLCMDNSLVRYFFMNGRRENYESAKTIYDFEVNNSNVLISFEKEVLVTDCNFGMLRSFNLKFFSRSRNEMFLSDKPCTSSSISYDGNILICGAQANEVKIVCLQTGCVIQTIKLSRNKEKENYKKRLGRERTDDFNPCDVIEAMKIKYVPNGFLILTRESVFFYKIKNFELDNITFCEQMKEEEVASALSDGKYVMALLGSVNSKSKPMIKECIRKIHRNLVDEIIRKITEENVLFLKNVVNELILEDFCFNKSLLWLKSIIYNFTGNPVESDLEVIKMLRTNLNLK